MSIYADLDGGNNFDEGEYGGVPRTADALSSALADIANSDGDDNNNEDDNEDRESCNVDGGEGVMSLPSCLDDELPSLTCLNNDKLNVFDVDNFLDESIASLLCRG